MECYVDCVHCYLKQATNCMSIADVDHEKQHRVLLDLMDHIKVMDRRRTPAKNSTELLLKVYRAIGNDDPYKEVKARSNAMALKMYPRLKEFLQSSPDRLYDALKISVAGNVIDLGINKDFDIEAGLKHSLESGFARDDYELFIEKLGQTADVLVVGDNAGEIVFDRLLVEELLSMGKKVTYMVKGGPILNDATMDDAVQSGMDKLVRVVTTGSNYLGAHPDKLSPEAGNMLANAGLVISKGQANFESLENEKIARGQVFFLLKMKCECVSRVAGAKLGDIVFFTR